MGYKAHPLRLLREALGLKQSEFAELLDVTQGAISQIENGHTRGTNVVLAAFDRWPGACKRLGLDAIKALQWEAPE